MASREDSDDGGHHQGYNFPVQQQYNGSAGLGPNDLRMQVEYQNIRIREMQAQNSMIAMEKERLESHNMKLKVRCETLHARYEQFSDECKTLKKRLQEVETELNVVMGERDPVLLENQELSSKNEMLTKEIDKITREKGEALKDVSILRDKVEQLKSRGENDAHLESANEEIQRLVKSRDHAIQEREKIMQECESVRKFCDVIRKERDCATSKQLEAFRQRDEAFKKIKELNEQIEQLSSSNRNSMRSYSPSPYDLETEKIEVDISRVSSVSDLGLILSTNDVGDEENSNAFVMVANIEPTSIFIGKLKINDFICQVNNRDCTTSSKQAVLNAIRSSSTGRCSITIKRKKKRSTYPTQLNLNHNIDFDYGGGKKEVPPVVSRNAKLRQIEESLESFKDYDIEQFSDTPKTNEKLSSRLHGNSRQHNNRMVNSCTQTETKRMSLDLSTNNNYFVPPRMGYNNTSTNTPSPQLSSKSASKIGIGGMFQKLFSKDNKVQQNNYKESQEDDAIAMLDNVLESDQDSPKSPPTKDPISKKIRRKEESEKNVGTWPRTSMNPTTNHASHSGTIVQPRKKVRPQLYPIFSDATEPTNRSENNNSFVPVATPNVNKINRNSNPIPFDLYKLPPSKYTDLPKPTYQRPINKNRFSLQPQSQIPIDFIPIKSSHEMPASYKQSTATTPVKLIRDADFFSPPTYPKNMFDSDTIPENSSGYTSTYPVHMRNKPSSVSQSHRPPSYLYNQLNYHPQLVHHTYNRRHPSPNDIFGQHQLIDSLPHHSHGSSIDYPYRKLQTSKEAVPAVFLYEGCTLPRNHKDNQRIRIPSNQSMTSRGSGVKNSSGSLDYGSERASPVPTYTVKTVNPGRTNENGVIKNPEREIQIENVKKALGFTIFDPRPYTSGGEHAAVEHEGKIKGIFVESVTESSIADLVGLKVGDQLLEFQGINMRAATVEQAVVFLKQNRNIPYQSVSMLVQHNPDDYKELMNGDNINRSNTRSTTTRSGSPTPQNSPQTTRSMMSADSLQQQFAELSTASQPSGTIRSIRSSQMSSKASKDFCDSIEHQSNQSSPGSFYVEAPRTLYMETRNSKELGISLLGGNQYGIFVHSIKEDSIADRAGLQVGDQILEYNGVDLRRSTAEEAAYELAKSADVVKCLVQYNPQKCNEIKNCPGDSFYIRVGFDRNCDLNSGELSFQKDEVLYVDNTMFRGTSQWRAYKLNEIGDPIMNICGVIPSQRSCILGDTDDGESTTRRGSTSARRSFFKRIKPQRSSSKDSKELASYSSTHLSLYSDSSMLSDLDAIPSYQRVEKLHYKFRPVLILGLGLLSEVVVNKLLDDFQDQFIRCKLCRTSNESVVLNNSLVIDHKRRGSHFECTTVGSIREARTQNKHCVLDICVSTLERLYRNQIYPIVLLIRFKHARQIKDIIMKHTMNTITGKVAQETIDHTQKLESDYRQFISAIIPGGVNITHISTQIKEAVDVEQKKILWVPAN